MLRGPPASGGEPGSTIRNKVKVAFLLRANESGVQPMRRSRAHKSLGDREPQCSKWKGAIMHKVFIVISLFRQSCAN